MRVPRASGNLANRAAPPSVPKVLRAHRRNRRDRPGAQCRTARTRVAALPGCREVPRPAEPSRMTAVLRRATRRSQSFPSRVQDDDDSPRCGRASKRSPQPMKPKSTSVPSACARVHASVHACCAARVPAGSMRRRTRAPVARSSAGPAAAHDEPISDQGCRHTRMHHCNRLARENGRDRAGPRRESAETSYRMTRQCCVFSPPASPTAKGWS